MNTTAAIAGCQAIRKKIGACCFGFRVVHGECVFVTGCSFLMIEELCPGTTRQCVDSDDRITAMLVRMIMLLR